MLKCILECWPTRFQMQWPVTKTYIKFCLFKIIFTRHWSRWLPLGMSVDRRWSEKRAQDESRSVSTQEHDRRTSFVHVCPWISLRPKKLAKTKTIWILDELHEVLYTDYLSWMLPIYMNF
jgi:hypothetical protein